MNPIEKSQRIPEPKSLWKKRGPTRHRTVEIDSADVYDVRYHTVYPRRGPYITGSRFLFLKSFEPIGETK